MLKLLRIVKPVNHQLRLYHYTNQQVRILQQIHILLFIKLTLVVYYLVIVHVVLIITKTLLFTIHPTYQIIIERRIIFTIVILIHKVLTVNDYFLAPNLINILFAFLEIFVYFLPLVLY
jgi:hypothetical protein